jgi:hypothetical protein
MSGCSVGALAFSNFTYVAIPVSGTPSLVPASEVQVVPVSNGERRVGLSFRANWVAAFEASDHLIFYQVSTLSGQPAITDAYLDWSAFRIGLAVASLDEFLCIGDTFSNGCAGGQRSRFYLRDSFVPSNPVAHISFPPAATVGALKDVFVLGLVGVAGITRADNEWEYIPEPSSASMFAGGALLAAALGYRRRLTRRTSINSLT